MSITMKHCLLRLVILSSVSACGGSGGAGPGGDASMTFDSASGDHDASTDGDVTSDAPVAATVTISGTAQSASGIGQQQAVQGATIAAYASSDDTTALATTTTDAQGQFSLTVDTGGAPLHGYLK